MSDKMRWRYGDTNPVVAAIDAATVIEIGDLVYQKEPRWTRQPAPLTNVWRWPRWRNSGAGTC